MIKPLSKSLLDFLKDECFYLAGGISYFSIMSLVPLSLLIVALFGYLLGGNEEIYRFILARLVSLFPSVTAGITAELRNIITYKGISLLTVFVYAFLSLQLFYSMEHAMNVIFKVPKKRHFFISILWSILIVTLVTIFFLLSFTISSTASALRQYPVDVLGFKIGYKAGIFIKYIAPFIIILMSYTAVYIIVPKVKVSLKNAFSGALFTTILWEVAKHFFTWYVKNVIQIGTIYGSLTTFIVFLLWVYYSSCIFLLGAELVNNLEKA
ncbi:MAG: YihY/virulence factor BrkB family protein [Nitrospirae bacterium]|nr:YihY/virulence factor BrkB family protein [Nitrospirota bacterium]